MLVLAERGGGKRGIYVLMFDSLGLFFSFSCLYLYGMLVFFLFLFLYAFRRSDMDVLYYYTTA